MDEFLTPEERTLSAGFLAEGHVILPAEDRAALEWLQSRAATLAAGYLGLPAPGPGEAGEFLDGIHRHIGADGLNGLRLHVIDGINAEPRARPRYFAAARRALEILVGNELAMQMRLNLSIQLPDDDGSLLPLHADVWNGDSPYEVVLWIPLVDCHRTKSMFLAPPEVSARHQSRLGDFAGVEGVFRAIEPELRWLEVPFGRILIFSQNLMHGNRINREPDTRWSMNCRFKSVFSPYADKRPGEFFEPVTLRPATRLGAAYHLPEGFDE